MQRVVIGTAGHIDHGKTTLIQALTGIDCDRWAEEKARGITIDLGFAHLEDGDGPEPLQVGFVDVPGHERFLHNALAGLGGIRLMLLVVAADEGVKPQTREHVAICSLLDIPHAVVALTKRDAVDAELLELAQLELEDFLESTPYAGSPILPVASTTGDGVDELRRTLVSKAREIVEPPDLEQPVRLPVDRAFKLRGLGAVVTGTLVGGRMTPGTDYALLPGELKPRVRSLQVHGEAREEAVSGERTAVQLTGVELGDLERGMELVTPDVFTTSKSLVARFRLLDEAPEAMTSFVPIRFHLLASEVVGKLRPLDGPLEPGATGLVEIRLAEPVVAVRGDRFVIRRPSPALTFGGGEILDPRWRRRRGRSLAAALPALEELPRSLEFWAREPGERGVTPGELRSRLGGRPEPLEKELGRLVADGKLLKVETGRGVRFVSPEASVRVTERAKKVLKGYFAKNRLARGMPKAELLARILPKRAQDLADVYLGWLEAQKILERDGDLVNPPGREAKLTGEESELSKKLQAAIEAEGLTPPSPQEFASRLDTKQQILDGVMGYLLERRRLVRLPSGLVLSTRAIDELKATLLADDAFTEITVAQFKDHFGLSRKWAIPLLEHLDSIGFTRRVGDKRQLVRRST